MKRILVIEDDGQLLKVIVTTLVRCGYHVLTACDGADGLALARAEMPDLVITDVEMPVLSGNDVLKELRGNSATASIPCIMMTSRPDITSMRLGMFLGADDYLAKPFPMADLIAAVKGRLRRYDYMCDLAAGNAARYEEGLGKTLPHELLTPLTGVLGLAQLLKSDCESLKAAEIFEMASLMEQSGERLLRLIQNYLLFTEIQLMTADPSRAKALAGGGIRESRKIVTTAAEGCAQRAGRLSDLSLDLAEGSVAIGDFWFRKLVDELVDNAFKFSAKGNRVQVNSGHDPVTFVLSVSDHGRGMTADQIAGIGAYQQFERKRYEQQGLGLGLIIGKRITEMHGGTFTIHSQVSTGTTVEVRLPAIKA